MIKEASASFSALQRAEIAEMLSPFPTEVFPPCFSALQRAEIAEIWEKHRKPEDVESVSVLFNEPKLLKWHLGRRRAR